jgi:hypothetical protein
VPRVQRHLPKAQLARAAEGEGTPSNLSMANRGCGRYLSCMASAHSTSEGRHWCEDRDRLPSVKVRTNPSSGLVELGRLAICVVSLQDRQRTAASAVRCKAPLLTYLKSAPRTVRRSTASVL